MPVPGEVRDAIIEHLALVGTDQSVKEIVTAVEARLGTVPRSSVASYLGINTPRLFERVGRGRYRLAGPDEPPADPAGDAPEPVFVDNLARLYHADCFDWLARQPQQSVQAVVTDPPYGLVEYTPKEVEKLRANKGGGVWRVPPSFDGVQRAPLPRFTVLDHDDRRAMHEFFLRLAKQFRRVLVPGANVVIASNPLLAHIVAGAMAEGGLELRGYIARLVMTMRGGDRPKGAHDEFPDVSVMPRSMWEPWVVLRAPLDGTVSQNLRRWKTGGFRRRSAERPFGDVIQSGPTPSSERRLAPHPSLKPQDLLRQIVQASLPLREGVVLDPFAGSGSTLAAATAVGYHSLGVEADATYAALACKAIPLLAAVPTRTAQPPARPVPG